MLREGVDRQRLVSLGVALVFAAVILWRLLRPHQLILGEKALTIRWSNDKGIVKAEIPYPLIRTIEFHRQGRPGGSRMRMLLATTEDQLYNLQIASDSVREMQTFLGGHLRPKPTALTWSEQEA